MCIWGQTPSTHSLAVARRRGLPPFAARPGLMRPNPLGRIGWLRATGYDPFARMAFALKGAILFNV